MKNQEYYNIQFKKYQSLREIPEEYRTNEMYDEYYRLTGDTSQIPAWAMTEEMYYQELYNQTGDITKIPKNQRTDFMYENLLRKTKDINQIPENRRTQSIYNIMFEITGDLNQVPYKRRRKTMCLKYFKKTKDIRAIPLEFITPDMCLIYLIEHQDASKIPPTLLEKVKEKLKENINKIDIQTYRMLKDLLEIAEAQVEATKKRLEFFEELIDALGPINGKMDNKQKIFFAYNAFSHGMTSIEKLYRLACEYQNQTVISFIEAYFGTNRKYKKVKIENSWCTLFDKNTANVDIPERKLDIILSIMKQHRVPLCTILVNMGIESYKAGDIKLNNFLKIIDMFNIAEVKQKTITKK